MPEPETVETPEPTAQPVEGQSVTELLEAGFDAIQAGTDEEPEPEASDADPAPDPEPEAEAATEDDAEPEAVAAPEHWSQSDKDFLTGLPDDAARERVQEWRKQIERGAEVKFEEAGAMRREVEGINKALEPLEPMLQQHGIAKDDAVRRLVTAHQDLSADLGRGMASIASQYARSVAGTGQAQEVVRQVAQALGVEIGGSAAAPGQAEKDPAKIAEEAARRVIEQRDRADAQRTLTAFVEAKDDGGNAKHPHYADVKPVMQGLLMAAAQSGQQMTLEQAYEQAVWTHEPLREAKVKAKQESAAKAADEARRSKVANARNAGTPQTRSAPARQDPASTGPQKSTTTLLEEGWAEAFAGAAH